jgi:AraC-like DNA-binding protein/uncharacterized glyoxalase superfamily protein PhnB
MVRRAGVPVLASGGPVVGRVQQGQGSSVETCVAVVWFRASAHPSAARSLVLRRGTISQVTSRTAAAQHLRDLARLRRVRDRIDREYAQPLDVEALARGAHMSAGHLSREFRLAYGESPYAYLMTRRIERAMALLRGGDLSVTEVCFAVGCSSLGTFSTRFTELVGVPPSLPEPRGAGDGGDAAVRGETGDQTDQESRSPGHRPATSVTAMDITIHATLLPHDDPDASLAFYRDTVGFEFRNDVEYGGMHWLTVGPPDQPGTSIVLYPLAATPGITDDERRTVAEMMAKGTYASINLATTDLDGVFERLQAGDAEVVQEPTEQPYGVRDCAFRDPSGTLVRIQELR